MRFDRMDTMAIGADGRQSIATCDRLSMDTLSEFALHLGVALCTGRGDVELEDRGLGVAGGQNFVGSVAVGANRGFVGSSSDCLPVDTLLIRQEGLGTV